MEFNNNYSGSRNYDNPIFDSYLYHNREKLYTSPTPSTYSNNDAEPSSSNNSFSLDEILLQDSTRLLDQVVNTALNISYRIKIYRDSNVALENKWNELSSEIGGLNSFSLGYNMNIERRRSMLEKERNSIEKQRLENKLQTWNDLNEPVRYMVQNFHKHLESKQDHKLIQG